MLRVASAGGSQDRARAARRGRRSSTTTALSRALRPAVAANVLVVDGEGYAFRHALIREAVHDDLLPGEHTRLHTRFAEALERRSRHPARPAGGAIELAHHWHCRARRHLGARQRVAAAAAARKSAAYAE